MFRYRSCSNRAATPLFSFVCTVLVLAGTTQCAADENPAASAEAPAGTDVFETTFDGTWFVDRKLKKRYDKLMSDTQSLSKRLRNNQVSSKEATTQLKTLREELQDVLNQIEKKKKLVSAFEVVTQEVEDTIELGAEQLLVVTLDRVKVVGWDGPGLKYVLRRKVLSTGQPVDEHLAAIKVIHKNGIATDLVGRTDEEMQAWKDDFLTAKDGETQTADQLAAKEKTWLRHFAGGERHPQFVGRKVDAIHIEGLRGKEGNRHLRYELKSAKGGGGQHGGRWQRNADLTLYVPKCTAVLLRGCLEGTDVSGLNADLTMTSAGSRDRDYAGKFSVRNHTGALNLLNVPMDLVENVDGSVTVKNGIELANTGSHHSGGTRVMYMPPPRPLRIAEVTGKLNFYARRSDLTVQSIHGGFNVANDFGDTHCTLTELPAGRHRIVSQAGRVELKIPTTTGVPRKLFAATCTGTLKTNLSRNDLDDLNVTYASGIDGLRQNWRSLFSKLPDGDFSARWALHERPDRILLDEDRSEGLDLISVAGLVNIQRERSEN